MDTFRIHLRCRPLPECFDPPQRILGGFGVGMQHGDQAVVIDERDTGQMFDPGSVELE